MKKVYLFFVSILIPIFSGYAADLKEHVVERGETLQSISRTYQVTEESLLEANPMAKDMFYAGMVLVIPESSNSGEAGGHYTNNITTESNYSKDRVNNVSEISKHDNTQNASTETNVNAIGDNGIEEFGGWCLYYAAPFDYFEHGYYGFGWRSYYSSGFGATLSLNANYGLGDGNVLCKFGPIYGYRLTDWLAVNAALRGFVSTYDKVKVDMSTGKTSSDFAVTGGITLTPGFEFKIGKLILGFGYEFGWCHGNSRLYHNAELSIGLHI